MGFLAIVVAAALPARSDDASQKKDRILKLFVDEFIDITPGAGKFPATFTMGSADGPPSEKPPVKVTFKKPFALARYEVTQELYDAVIGKNPSKWKGPRNSVEMVSWSEANEFCVKISAELRQRRLIREDEVIRLPSEAEWEYACRAGTTTRYSFGDDARDLGDYGWFDGNAKGNDPPVGKKKPNAWGFHDMHGYVWEWCADAWSPTLDGTPADGTPRQRDGAKEHPLRGGSWADGADKARSACRHRQAADYRSDAIGFRCVRARK
jgi:formylglycine-generating enzyme required for sulfatase activity